MLTLDKLLLVVVPLLAGWNIAAIYNSKLQRRFPLFMTYLVALIAIGSLRLAATSDYRLYFWVFWLTEALYAVLALAALHEVFRQIFLGFYLRYIWFRLLFPCVAVLAIVIAFWMALYHPPIQASRMIRIILLIGIAVSFMQLSLFLLFVALAKSFRLSWRCAPLGITLGFAISAFGTSLAYWLFSTFGTKLQTLGKYGPPVAYILASVVWLDTFLRPEAEPQWQTESTMKEMINGIRRDTEAFKRNHG
jgi:hypothetical protein